MFIDVINDTGLEQFVRFPTRQNSVLDLVFSSHPRISDLDIVPGISDHDAIIFNCDIIHQVETNTKLLYIIKEIFNQ